MAEPNIKLTLKYVAWFFIIIIAGGLGTAVLSGIFSALTSHTC